MADHLDNAALVEANIEIVRRFVDGINAEDVDGLRDLLDEDRFTFSIPWGPEGFVSTTQGGENWLRVFQGWTDMIVGGENLQDLRVEAMWSDPGQLIAFYRAEMVMKASNAPYSNDYIGLFTVRDGKVTRFDEYMDPIRIVQALGGTVRLAGE